MRRRRSQGRPEGRAHSRRHTAGGEYLAVPIGRAQERLALCLASNRGDGPEALVPQGTTVILGASCPAVAYQQGAADYCVAYGAASACFTPATTPPPRRSLVSPRRRCTAAMRSASSATFFTLSTAGASAAEAPRPVHRLDQHAGHPAGSPALSVVTRCKMRASAPLPVPCNSTQPLTFSYQR